MKIKTIQTDPTMPTNTTTTHGQLGPRATHGNGPMFAPREATMWMTTPEMQSSGPAAWRGNNVRRTKDGIERLPSVAHTGESDYLNREVHPRAYTRYRMMLDAQGSVCAMVHSNAAGHLPAIVEGKWTSDGYAAHVLRKGYALGWIDVNAGCLKRQLADGLVNPRRLLVDLSKSKVCGKDSTTCKHIEAEKVARQAKQKTAMQKLEDAAAVKDPSIAIGVAVAKALAAHEASKVK